LAKMLSAYGIAPVVQRFAGKLARGYRLEQFKDVFARYYASERMSCYGCYGCYG
jgi:Protein of unknown function (DUF3631)